jgi:hypothetical protein
VTIRPSHPGHRAPNAGQWFAIDAAPGRPVPVDAIVTNPSDRPVRIRLSTADLRFRGDEPDLVEPPRDVGNWIQLPVTELDVPGAGEVPVHLTVTVPTAAEPGDHIGAVIAENIPGPGNGALQVITRAATRFYVTVPGDVQARVRIERVHVQKDRTIAPRWATVSVTVRNTGNVKLATTVRVDGARADGSANLLSHSREEYVIRRRIPAWGGPISWPVRLTTRSSEGSGPSLAVNAHTFAFPIVPILLVALTLLALVAGWQLAERRRKGVDELAAELKRIEERLNAR